MYSTPKKIQGKDRFAIKFTVNLGANKIVTFIKIICTCPKFPAKQDSSTWTKINYNNNQKLIKFIYSPWR